MDKNLKIGINHCNITNLFMKPNISNVLILVIALLSLLNCTKKQSSKNHMLIGEPDFKSVITLKGDSIFSDKGISFVSIFDTILVTDKIYGNDERFDCYSLRSLKKLGSFGRKGRGPGEFTKAFLLKHFDCDSTGVHIWIIDGTRKKVVKFNLHSLIRNPYGTEPDYEIRFPDKVYSAYDAFFTHEDSIIIQPGDYPSRFIISDVNFKNQFFSSLYPVIGTNTDPTLQQSFCILSADQRVLVSAMTWLDRIDFVNTSTGLPVSTIVSEDYESLNLTEIHENRDFTKAYFTDANILQNNILLLRKNRLRENNNTKKSPEEIWVFDQNFNPSYKIMINEGLNRIAIDPKLNMLYGIDVNSETVYKYDLSFLVKN